MITRYVLVGQENREGDHEYESYDEAIMAAQGHLGRYAVIERQYRYDDSELVWTPDGATRWPPADTG